MKKMIKRTASILIALSIISCTGVFAEWEFSGYDTTVPGKYEKLYNEKLDGNYTSKQKSEPVKDKDVEWKFEGYELSYPHTSYERLYLEGNAQKNVTRLSGLYPQWETRFRDFMWEVCGDHKIYQRQQTKINGKYWAWDFGNDSLGIPDSAVFVPTNRYAKTTDKFIAKGVANLNSDGYYIFDEKGKVYSELDGKEYSQSDETYKVFNGPFENSMPKAFNKNSETKAIIDGLLTVESLSAIDYETGAYCVTDEMIAEYIDIPHTKYTTGPSFYGENSTKDVADMYIKNANNNWSWDKDVATIEHNAKIQWTKPMYEMAEPYNYYQFLIVNGLVLDGRADTPRVFRYTGGKASPKVEWKYCFAQKDYPYEVVEVKYIENNDGKMIPAVNEDGTPIVRIPTGKYANSYFVVTDTEIQVWIKDDVASYKIVSEPKTLADYGNSYNGYTSGAAFVD